MVGGGGEWHEHKIIDMIEIIEIIYYYYYYYYYYYSRLLSYTRTHARTHTHALTRISAAQQQADPTHRTEIVTRCSLVGLVNNTSSVNTRENTSFIPNKILHTAQGYTWAYIAFPCRLPFSFCIIACFPLIPPSPPHTHTYTHTKRYVSFSCLSPLSGSFQ